MSGIASPPIVYHGRRSWPAMGLMRVLRPAGTPPLSFP